MKKSKLKKLCAVLLAANVTTSLFIGCGKDNVTNTGGADSKQEMVYNLY